MVALAWSGLRRIEAAGLAADTVWPGAVSESVFFSDSRTCTEMRIVRPCD